MSVKIFAVWMTWIKSLLFAVSKTLKTRNFKVWACWTASTIIAVTGAFFYISAAKSIVEWSFMPLYLLFFYHLTWFVIIGTSIFASTGALIMTGLQDGFDNLPIASPIFVAKETITFPIWFPKEVYRMLRS